MLIGAHVSPAGGPAKAVQRGEEQGAEAIQIFNQNPRAWKPTVYSDEQVADFQEAMRASKKVQALLIHAVYLLNPASEEKEFRDKTLASLIASLQAGDRMGAHAVVLHAGSAKAGDVGKAIRVHGDLHLGQLLLADAGWFVIDFEGEPARPVDERMRPSSPLRDVAGMVRSFQYAARTALVERGRDIDDDTVVVADAWETRAVEAFWRGYTRVEGIDALLPADDADRRKLLRAFELDKAVYEVIYEIGHRPDWVDVPASAIRRTLARVA